MEPTSCVRALETMRSMFNGTESCGKDFLMTKKPCIPADSWSYTGNENFKHRHAWTVEKFSERIIRGKLESSTFTVRRGNYMSDWSLALYPNGLPSTGHPAERLLTLIWRTGGKNDDPADVDVKFSLVDKDGMQIERDAFPFPSRSSCLSSEEMCAHDLEVCAPNFFSQSELVERFLPSDTLTILCELTFLSANTPTIGGSIDKPDFFRYAARSLIRVIEDVTFLFESGKLADCTVECEGQEFFCHKCILMARSTIFNAMLTHNMEENQLGKVVIKDLDADIVHSMLRYMYSGTAPNLNGQEARLLVAAQKYDLNELKQLCEARLSEKITISNALDLVLLADLHNASTLREQALAFIVTNGEEIVRKPGWRKVLKAHPDVVADLFEASHKRQRIS